MSKKSKPMKPARKVKGARAVVNPCNEGYGNCGHCSDCKPPKPSKKPSKLAARIVEDVLQCVEGYGLSLRGGKLDLAQVVTDGGIESSTRVMERRVDVILKGGSR